MKYCIYCGEPLHEESVFCSKCGKKQKCFNAKKDVSNNKVEDCVEENVNQTLDDSESNRFSFTKKAKAFFKVVKDGLMRVVSKVKGQNPTIIRAFAMLIASVIISAAVFLPINSLTAELSDGKKSVAAELHFTALDGAKIFFEGISNTYSTEEYLEISREISEDNSNELKQIAGSSSFVFLSERQLEKIGESLEGYTIDASGKSLAYTSDGMQNNAVRMMVYGSVLVYFAFALVMLAFAIINIAKVQNGSARFEKATFNLIVATGLISVFVGIILVVSRAFSRVPYITEAGLGTGPIISAIVVLILAAFIIVQKRFEQKEQQAIKIGKRKVLAVVCAIFILIFSTLPFATYSTEARTINPYYSSINGGSKYIDSELDLQLHAFNNSTFLTSEAYYQYNKNYHRYSNLPKDEILDMIEDWPDPASSYIAETAEKNLGSFYISRLITGVIANGDYIFYNLLPLTSIGYFLLCASAVFVIFKMIVSWVNGRNRKWESVFAQVMLGVGAVLALIGCITFVVIYKRVIDAYNIIDSNVTVGAGMIHLLVFAILTAILLFSKKEKKMSVNSNTEPENNIASSEN